MQSKGLSRVFSNTSQGRWDPDSLRPALSLGGQASAWEGSPGRSLCLTKSSACGRLWQFAPLKNQADQNRNARQRTPRVRLPGPEASRWAGARGPREWLLALTKRAFTNMCAPSCSPPVGRRGLRWGAQSGGRTSRGRQDREGVRPLFSMRKGWSASPGTAGWGGCCPV